MHKFLKTTSKIGLVVFLLLGTSYSTASIHASSWNWTKAFSLNRALKNSDHPNTTSASKLQKHHQATKLYHELRAHHFSPDASLAILTLVHTNNSNYASQNVWKNTKLDNGYLGFNRALNNYLLDYARGNKLNPNHLFTQADFMLKFYGLNNFKASHQNVNNLIKQLSNMSNMDTQLATKATDNDIHTVLLNLK